MTNKNLERLIDNLGEDLKPQKPMKHPLLRMLPLLVLTPILTFAIAHFIGMRADWSEMMMYDTRFQLEIGLALAIALSSGAVLGWVNLPDMRQQPWVLAIPLVFMLVFFGYIGYMLYQEGLTGMKFQTRYFSDAFMLSLIPTLLLLFILKKGCPSCHKKTALFATMAIAAFSWIGLRLTCPIDYAGHNFIVQFAPFFVLGLLAALFSAKLFKW